MALGKMALPPLYKYLDIAGAKLTLQTGTFRHGEPSNFNDLEELTIRSIFPQDEEVVLTEMKNVFVDILVENIDRPPTCVNPQMKAKIALMQGALKKNRNAANILREAIDKEPLSSFFNVDHMKERNRSFIRELNEFMQGHRIICVSKRNDSEAMWRRYAQNHHGIVLRILPNESKDSKYLLFREVSYGAARPSLYESGLRFLQDSLFGDQKERLKALMDKIIYTKTLKWKGEEEYRLAIPIFDRDNWTTLPYHPEEITEMYFGHESTEEEKNELIKLAVAMNPGISIFQAFLDSNKKMSFRAARWAADPRG